MTTTALSRERAWAITIAATLVMVVSYIDRQTLSVLSPTVTSALHITDAGYGWLASAFSITYLFGAPLAGRWIDRVGARQGMVYAVLLWSIVAALHVIVPGFAVLFALRIALGAAESPSFPGASQAIHRALPPKDRARGFGLLFTGSSIGGMLAPWMAVTLKKAFGWRMAFVGTALAGLLWLPLWVWATHSKASRQALDTAPADDSPTPVRPAATALAAMFDPMVIRAMVLIIASAPVVAFVLLWGARFLVHDRHITQDEVAHYLWLPPLLFDLGAITFGDLHARRAASLNGAPDRLLAALAGGLMLTIAFVPGDPTVWGSMILAGVAMAGGGALYALITSDLYTRIAPGQVSIAGGMCAAAQSLAYIIANPLFGQGVKHWGNYDNVLVCLGAWVVPGLLVWLSWVPGRRPSQ